MMLLARTMYRGRVHSATEDAKTDPRLVPSVPANVSPTFTEVLPGVALLASVNAAKNQCIIELVKPGGASDSSTSLSSSQMEEEDPRQASPTRIVPPTLLAAFRAPRIIQVMAEDEGTITTIELVTERAGESSESDAKPAARGTVIAGMRDRMRSPLANSAAAKRLQPSRVGEREDHPRGPAAPPSIDNVFVHLFIGTSNGTVMVCNALRGTILLMAQFQYHHDFRAMSSGSRSPSRAEASEGGAVAASPSPPQPRPPSSSTGEGSTGDAQQLGFLRSRPKHNEGVVRFVVQERATSQQQWNPDLIIPERGPTISSFGLGRGQVGGVLVVHERGKVVHLGRNVLDGFISVVVNRLDGQRPHFVLEWSPASTLSSYPVAGPASSVAPLVEFVYTLAPVPQFSENERRSMSPSSTLSSPASGGGATPKASTTARSVPSTITDAAFVFTSTTDANEVGSVLTRSTTENAITDAILTCGSTPAFTLYPLEAQRSEFSAAKAVKAVTSLVAGMARNLWYGRSDAGKGSTATASAGELPQRLEKRPQPHRVALLEGDAALSKVSIDPTQQFAAFYAESTVTAGAGRVCIANVHTGVVWRVLKGYRSAQLAWWMATVMDRPMLLLIVHLPQRGVAEVHSLRLRQRLAACYVPAGSSLLRRSVGGAPTPDSANPILILSPTGDVLQLQLDFDAVARKAAAMHADPQARLLRGPRPWGSTDGPKEKPNRQGRCGSVDKDTLRSCRSPDSFFDVAMQLHMPDWLPWNHPQEESTVRKANLDAFRKYRRQLTTVCDALKRRYTPSYAEPRAIVVAAHSAAGGTMGDAVPRGLTAAQCLNYLQLRGNVVDAYVTLALAATSSWRLLTDTRDREEDAVAAMGSTSRRAGAASQSSAGGARSGDTGSEAAAGAAAGAAAAPSSAEDTVTSAKHCLACRHASGKHFYDRAVQRLIQFLGKASTARFSSSLPSLAPGKRGAGLYGSEIAVLKARAATDWHLLALWKKHGSHATFMESGIEDPCMCLATDVVKGDAVSPKGTEEQERRRRDAAGGPVVSAATPLGPHRFLALFACGGNRVLFRRDAVQQLEDNTNRDIAGALADLYYGVHGINVFVRRLEVAAVLGLELTDLAELTLAWIAHRCAEGSPSLLACTSLGRLAFVLGTFPATAFLTALRRVAIPLQTRAETADVPQAVRQSLTDALALAGVCQGLLLCCAVHLARGGADDVDDSSRTVSFATTIAQLVRLWDAALRTIQQCESAEKKKELTVLEKAEELLVPARQTSGVWQSLGDHDAAICARLSYLLPGNLETGDSLDAFLLRKRVDLLGCGKTDAPTPTAAGSGPLLVAVPRPDAPPYALDFPFTTLCAILLHVGAEQHIGATAASSCFSVTVPWHREQTWLADTYQDLVLSPLAQTWSLVAPGNAGASGSSRGAEALWKATKQSCVVLTAVAALQEAVRPFMEADFSFWQSETVPDVNLFSQVVASSSSSNTKASPSPCVPRGLHWLMGSRAHRDYLTSLAQLSSLTIAVAEPLLADADEIRRVLLIQAITTVLTEDDTLVFPVVPHCLRQRLKVLMQLLGQQPDAVLTRVRRVQSFVSLLLFLADVGTWTVDGDPLDVGGMRAITVPWTTLFGAALSDSFLLYPSSSLTTPTGTPMKTPREGGNASVSAADFCPDAARAEEERREKRVALRAASCLARSFLSACVLPGVSRAVLQKAGNAVDDASTSRLTHQHTKDVLMRLAQCFGLCDIVPDLPALLVIDFAIKHMCGFTAEVVGQELLYVADRGLAARVAACDIRVALGCCVKYCATAKRYYLEHNDKARFDAASQKMINVLQLFSDRCKQWIQRPGKGGKDGGGGGGGGGATATTRAPPSQMQVESSPLSYEIVGSPDWVSPAELDVVDHVVLGRLSLPPSDPLRKDLFELLFLLAQLVNEEKAFLSAETRSVAAELPSLVDNLRRQL